MWKSDYTDAEKTETQNIIIGALRLLKTIEVAITNGFDAGDLLQICDNCEKMAEKLNNVFEYLDSLNHK